ncbi:hypothetical protein QMS68_17605, partial [Cronobacter malonaticus]|nr:hypothetical protein [Cronobacter malonaticus]
GDIAAEGIGRVMRRGGQLLQKGFTRNQRYLAEAITEEWRVAPGALEIAWFAEEVSAAGRQLEELTKRLDKLEGK